MANEDFAQSHRWQDEGLARISNPHKRLVIMPRSEDADGHCTGTNLSLVAQTAFDWLDDLFDGRSAAESGEHERMPVGSTLA